MKTISWALVVAFCTCAPWAQAKKPCPKNISFSGLGLGMSRKEVKKVYERYKAKPAAKYVSLESEKFRDLIKLDNEFSSMGNKIEISYDPSGKVSSLTFHYKTVNILLGADKLGAEQLAKRIAKDYCLPEMKLKDLGMVKIWSYTDEAAGYKISIDDNKNLRLKKL